MAWGDTGGVGAGNEGMEEWRNEIMKEWKMKK